MRAARRSLRHVPGFSALVIGTLGVALGANIALFSAANVLLLAGLCVAVTGGRAVEGLLFGVRPTDAGTVAVTGIVMTGLVLSASLLAAWRAARVDPLAALRDR